MILVKPVSYLSFISSKWAAMLSLVLLSFTAGYGAAWYYTVSLFQSVNSQWVTRSFILFALWLVFVGTLTIWFSSLLRSAAAAAFSALAVAAVFALTASLLPSLFQWSPGNLPQLALAQLAGQSSREIWPYLSDNSPANSGISHMRSMDPAQTACVRCRLANYSLMLYWTSLLFFSRIGE